MLQKWYLIVMPSWIAVTYNALLKSTSTLKQQLNQTTKTTHLYSFFFIYTYMTENFRKTTIHIVLSVIWRTKLLRILFGYFSTLMTKWLRKEVPKRYVGEWLKIYQFWTNWLSNQYVRNLELSWAYMIDHLVYLSVGIASEVYDRPTGLSYNWNSLGATCMSHR